MIDNYCTNHWARTQGLRGKKRQISEVIESFATGL